MKTIRFDGFVVVYVAAASAFLVLMALDMAGVGRTLLKAIPVSMLMVLVLREMRGFVRTCLTGALLGSVCGDVLLDLASANLFLFGLAAFLAAHLFYTLLFFRYAKKPAGFEKATIAGLLLFAGVMIWIFRGIPAALYGPVVLYILVIVTMTIGALLVPARSLLLFGGAVVFIASDLVLAINKFLVALPLGRVINISLYFIAQFMIITAARAIWAGTRAGGARLENGRIGPQRIG